MLGLATAEKKFPFYTEKKILVFASVLFCSVLAVAVTLFSLFRSIFIANWSTGLCEYTAIVRARDVFIYFFEICQSRAHFMLCMVPFCYPHSTSIDCVYT